MVHPPPEQPPSSLDHGHVCSKIKPYLWTTWMAPNPQYGKQAMGIRGSGVGKLDYEHIHTLPQSWKLTGHLKTTCFPLGHPSVQFHVGEGQC